MYQGYFHQPWVGGSQRKAQGAPGPASACGCLLGLVTEEPPAAGKRHEMFPVSHQVGEWGSPG